MVKVVDGGGEVIFKKEEAIIKHGGKITTKIPRHGNLYVWTATNNKKQNKTQDGIILFHGENDSEVHLASDPVPAVVVPTPSTIEVAMPAPPRLTGVKLLHARMGHTARSGIKHLIQVDAAKGLKQSNINLEGSDMKMALECEGCALGRSHRAAFTQMDPNLRPISIMDEWHCDTFGPIQSVDHNQLESLGGWGFDMRPS